MEFRLFAERDIPGMMKMIGELKKESAEISLVEIESEKELRKWNRTNEVVVVAAENDELLAVVKGTIGEGDKSHSAFLTAAVVAGSRSQGLAAELTDYLNQILGERGVKIVRAYVYSNNHASIKTIEKQGFVLGGRVLMHHFDKSQGAYVDDLIYHKLLERK